VVILKMTPMGEGNPEEGDSLSCSKH
jgi:hypothetical protein